MSLSEAPPTVKNSGGDCGWTGKLAGVNLKQGVLLGKVQFDFPWINTMLKSTLMCVFVCVCVCMHLSV